MNVKGLTLYHLKSHLQVHLLIIVVTQLSSLPKLKLYDIFMFYTILCRIAEVQAW